MLNVIRILFVCQKNTTLSPMTEQIFQNMLRKRRITDRFKVASAAVAESAQTGVPVEEKARKCLERAGLQFVPHTSNKLSPEDFEKYDWVVCMTEQDRRRCFDILKDRAVFVTPNDVRRVFKMDPASPISLDGRLKPRVCCLMDFTGFPRDVIDPELSGDYRLAFNEVSTGCASLLAIA